MRVSYNWLKQFIDIKVSPEKLAEKLTLAGFEVEKIHYIDKGIKNVVVGEIKEIKKHPQADKLQVVKVNIGKKVLNIVCGAFNIKVGQKVPVALPGASLSTIFDGMVVQKTKIRGVESEGMLCAEDELGVGDDHTGIYIFSDDVKVGQEVKKSLDMDDVIFEVDVPANRGDFWGHLGAAREVSALLNMRISMRINANINANFKEKINNILSVKVEDKDLCPKYTACVVKNVKVKPSPQWLKNKLLACGIRPINNVVDITNYVMLELGQPLHAFDVAALHADSRGSERGFTRIIVRKAKKREKILCLDDKERELDDSMLVIADKKKPVAIAGVMGGKESEISENTKDIILESAQFDPASIRQTSRKLGLRSESSARFERGVDWNITEVALERAAALIAELAGGKVEDNRIRVTDRPIYLRRVVKLPVKFVSSLLGVKFGKDDIVKTFRALGFIVSEFYTLKPNTQHPKSKKVIEEAKKLLDKKYKYGAKSSEAPNAFDCSSLTQYIYKKIGITVPRCSIEQAEVGQAVSKDKLQPGDLIFTTGNSHIHYNFDYPKGVGHVGIYVGQNKVIHANGNEKYGKAGVIEQRLVDFLKGKKFAYAKRLLDQKIDEPILIVTVPSWREDVNLLVDLVEEVGRIYDYNKMKPTLPVGELKPPVKNTELELENKIKDILIGCGFDEVYNYSFHGETRIFPELNTNNYTNIHTNKNVNKIEYLEVVNPLNPDQKYLRRSLVPRIRENIEKNLNNFDSIKIFEIGRVFLPTGRELPEERKKIALAIGSKEGAEENFKIIKGTLTVLFDELNVNAEKINYETKIKNNNVVIELDFNELVKNIRGIKKYQPIPIYPKVTRDLAIVVDKKIPYADIEKTIRKVDPLISVVELFDVFESKELGENKKSLAFHLDFQAKDRTLNMEEVDKIFNKIVKELGERFGAELRG